MLRLGFKSFTCVTGATYLQDWNVCISHGLGIQVLGGTVSAVLSVLSPHRHQTPSGHIRTPSHLLCGPKVWPILFREFG